MSLTHHNPPPSLVTLDAYQATKLRAKLRGGPDANGRPLAPIDDDGRPRTFVGSEPVLDLMFTLVPDPSPAVGRGRRRPEPRYRFDPQAGLPGQVRCGGCGRTTPPIDLTGDGRCTDCTIDPERDELHELSYGRSRYVGRALTVAEALAAGLTLRRRRERGPRRNKKDGKPDPRRTRRRRADADGPGGPHPATAPGVPPPGQTPQ